MYTNNNKETLSNQTIQFQLKTRSFLVLTQLQTRLCVIWKRTTVFFCFRTYLFKKMIERLKMRCNFSIFLFFIVFGLKLFINEIAKSNRTNHGKICYIGLRFNSLFFQQKLLNTKNTQNKFI